MKHLIILFILFPIVCLCQPIPLLFDVDFGFENKKEAGVPETKWHQWGINGQYKLRIDSVVRNSGKNSLLLESVNEGPVVSAGWIAGKIPAEYRGSKIELRAFMKLVNIRNGSVGLLLRTDGKEGIIDFKNTLEKNVKGTSDWKQYSIELPYSNECKIIYFAAGLAGTGQLWIDDFELYIDGKRLSQFKTTDTTKFEPETTREYGASSGISNFEITNSRIEDLTILAELWGFLKYFHPNVRKGGYNWDKELFMILPKVLNSKNQSQRNECLSIWVDQLGEFKTSQKIKDKRARIKVKPDFSWMTESVLGLKLTSQLNKIINAERQGENYYVNLVPNVGNPNFLHEEPYYGMYYDTGYRLLSLFRYWNIIQYYFPYKNLIEEDWKTILKENISKFISSSNELDYKKAVLSLIARIHDTHAVLDEPEPILEQYWGLNCAPLEITNIDGKFVVTGYYDQSVQNRTGIEIGDFIETVNGQTIDEKLKQMAPLISASNYQVLLRDIAVKLLRTNDSSIAITFNHNGVRYMKTISSSKINLFNIYRKFRKEDTCFKIINSNIAYLYIGTIKNEYLKTIIPVIAKTKGLIIDLRCAPSEAVGFVLSTFLLPKRTPISLFSVGSIETPGLFVLNDQAQKLGKSNRNNYKGKLLILVNEITQSSAEYHAMAFRATPHAKIVGGVTAGTDGNISSFCLPGGIFTSISGIGVYYPNGLETQRIGIIPDVKIYPTISGVKIGKDEILEKAVELINSK